MLWFGLQVCFMSCFFCIAPGCCIFFSLTANLLMDLHVVDVIFYHMIPFLLCQQLLNNRPFLNLLPYLLLTQFYSFFTHETVSYLLNFLLYYCIDRILLISAIIYLFNKNNRQTFPLVRMPIQPTSHEDLLCVVCSTNKKCMLLRPCNHACLCNDCTDTLRRENQLNECPMCRSQIYNIEQIFI